MTNKYSFIYLLVLEEKNLFKIGKANDIVNRYEILKSKWGAFDLEKSYLIKCEEKSIFKLEKTLHYIFKDFNVTLDEHIDGYTEWFDIQCYLGVIDVINNLKSINSDIIQINKGLSFPKKNILSNWQLLSKDEKKQRIQLNKKNKKLNTLNKNIDNANTIVKIMSDLEDKMIFFNKEQNLIVFQNVDKYKFDLLSQHQGFDYEHGGFNFITSQIATRDFIYVNLQFNYFEDKNIEIYEELAVPYRIIINYFNNLNFDKIETSVEIGNNYKKQQDELWNSIFT